MKKVSYLLILGLLLALLRPASASAPPKRVALTFDDGPSGQVTEQILDGLAKRGVKATFFVCGCQAAAFPQTLCRTAAEGHEIGLHSCCHDYMNELTEARIDEDISSCMCLVSEICGVRATLFRPPGGLYSEQLLKASEKEGLAVVLWSLDTRDWHKTDCRHSLSKILTQAKDGDIILMHDMRPSTVKIALTAIDRLRERGFAFCTVTELANAVGVSPAPGRLYRAFPAQAQ